MASARSMPPSIASRRARKTCSNRGDELEHHQQHDPEGDQADDDLAQGRKQRVGALRSENAHALSVPV